MITDPKDPADQHLVPPYLAPRDDAEFRTRENARMSAAAVLTAGSVLGLVFVWILSNLHYGVPPDYDPLNYAFPATLTAMATAALLGIGLFFRARHGSNAFLLGSLIGLGIGALIEGLCFAGLFRH